MNLGQEIRKIVKRCLGKSPFTPLKRKMTAKAQNIACQCFLCVFARFSVFAVSKVVFEILQKNT
jgi:hypothetical protein